MADTPAKTNITDEGDYRGATKTTLVSTHDRGSTDWNTRVGEGDPFGPDPIPTPPVNATSAAQGQPGIWAPVGSTPPASVAALQGASPAITASPTSAWSTGTWVQTGTAGAPGQAHWSGTAWVAGVTP